MALGTLISGGLALAGALTSKGKKGQYQQQQNLSPQQQDILKQLLGGISGPAANAGSLFNYNVQNSQPYQEGYGGVQSSLAPFDPTSAQNAFQSNVADPTIRDFQERILPTLQQSYISQGAGRSSGFEGTAASQGRRLMESLGAQRQAALNQQEQQSLNRNLQGSQMALNYANAPQSANAQQSQMLAQLLNTGLNTGYQSTNFAPGQEGPGQGLLGLAGGLYGYNKGGANRYENAMLGMKFGSSLGSLFGG